MSEENRNFKSVPRELIERGTAETPASTTAEQPTESPADVGHLTASQYAGFQTGTKRQE